MVKPVAVVSCRELSSISYNIFVSVLLSGDKPGSAAKLKSILHVYSPNKHLPVQQKHCPITETSCLRMMMREIAEHVLHVCRALFNIGPQAGFGRGSRFCFWFWDLCQPRCSALALKKTWLIAVHLQLLCGGLTGRKSVLQQARGWSRVDSVPIGLVKHITSASGRKEPQTLALTPFNASDKLLGFFCTARSPLGAQQSNALVLNQVRVL